MLELITGRPGSSKSLNLVKTICLSKKYKGRPKFYHNIKLMLLDYEQCKTFQAFFYDVYFPSLSKQEQRLLSDTINPVHEQKRFVTLDDFPFLEKPFSQHDPLDQWLKWVKICYSPSELKPLFEKIKRQPSGVPLTFKDFEKFNFHWTFFDDPKKWYEMQGHSVLCIDEAQEFFPVRSGKEKVPLYASKFERHRHDSFDVVLVTQHPAFLDVHIRRLVGHHTHYFNYWSSNGVTVYQWDKCVDPDDHFNKKDARKNTIKKPSSYYGVYFSAFEHTHRLNFPLFVLLLPLSILFVIACIWYGASTLFGGDGDALALDESDEAGLLDLPSDAPITLNQYLASRKPRIPDIPESAPIYDKLTIPKSYPKPKNCVLWNAGTDKETCICYSQRATRMNTPDYLCQNYVLNGYFDETISDKKYSQKSQPLNKRPSTDTFSRSPISPLPQ